MYTIDFSSIEFVDDVGSSFASLLEAQMEYGFISQIRYEQLPPKMKNLVDTYNEQHKKLSSKSNDDVTNINRHIVTHQFGDNITSAINFSIEQYDKASDELVLQSECLVEAYNKMICGKTDDAMNLLLKLSEAAKSDKDSIYDEIMQRKESVAGFSRLFNLCGNLTNTMSNLMKSYGSADITYRQIKEAVMDAEFYPSDDDPEKVKKIINARIQYNNTIMEMFKLMIYNNYELLGLSKDVALLYTAKLSSPDHSVQKEAVKDIKRTIKEQSNKFKIKGHRTWDFRPLGLGVLFQTEEDMGSNIEKYETPDHFIQILSQYDCVVLAHGGNFYDGDSKKLQNELKASFEKRRKIFNDKLDILSKQRDDLNDYLNTETDKIRAKLELKDNNYSEPEKFLTYVKVINSSFYKMVSQYADEIRKLKQTVSDDRIEIHTASADDRKIIEERIKSYEEEIKLYESKMAECKKDAHEAYDAFMKILNNKSKQDISSEFEDTIRPLLDKSKKKRDEYNEKIEQCYHKRNKLFAEEKKAEKALNRHIDKNKYWSIQPVYTLNAGPFTRVDDLVRQLIKEGFKKILLCNCNPGGHKLPKDITQKEGITIRMSKTNTLVESACETVDPYEQIHLDIENSQLNMAQMCESFNINYWDDISLNEITNDYNNTLESMNEGTLKNIWTKIKELIKKAVAIVVNLVKRLFDIIKTFIDKIKAWFKRLHESKKYDDKFKKSVKTSVIIVENASVDKFSANNWDDLENKTIKACSAIQKKIDELQNKQLKNYKELDKYADQMSKTANESSISELDSLVNMLW